MQQTRSIKNAVLKYEIRALCKTCLASNVLCTPNPWDQLAECASCKDKRLNPHTAKAEETSKQ